MLHRIKWEEHNSKRDGKRCLACESCELSCFDAHVRVTELFIINSQLDPDGDDDTKRNNKCWLIWEVSDMCCYLIVLKLISIT